MIQRTFMRSLINDITTTISPVPQFEAIANLNPHRDYAYRPEFWEIQKQKHPEIKPLSIKNQSMKDLLGIVKTILKKDLQMNLVEVHEDRARVEAIAITKWLRFRDDFLVVLESKGSDEILVQTRSKSRLGRDDFGANAKRILRFQEDLQKALEKSSV